MVIARPILMSASKDRPLTDQRHASGSRKEETSKQVTGFRGGQRDEWGADHKRCRWRRSGETSVEGDVEEEGVGKQDQGDMPIPAEVTAHFVVRETQSFGGFQVL